MTLVEQVFQYHKSEDLSAAAAGITIQQPASGATRVYFLSATIDCEVATVVTIKQGGTAASTTDDSSAIRDLNQDGTAATPAAEAYHTSNVGAGDVAEIHDCPAAGSISIDLDGYVLIGDGATKNLTIATDSVTGMVRITVKWREEAA